MAAMFFRYVAARVYITFSLRTPTGIGFKQLTQLGVMRPFKYGLRIKALKHLDHHFGRSTMSSR